MARQDFEKAIKRVQSELKKSSQIYREESSNLKPHIFTVSAAMYRREISTQLVASGRMKSQKEVQENLLKFDRVKDQIDITVNNMLSIIEETVTKDFAGKYRHYKVVDSKRRKGNVFSFQVEVEFYKKYNVDAFSIFKDAKQRSEAKLIEFVDGALMLLGRQLVNRGSFLDISHDEGSEVISQREAEALRQISELESNGVKGSAILERLGISLNMSKNTKGVVSISIESAEVNRGRGRTIERQRKAQLIKDVEKVVTDLGSDYWANLGGSDSDMDVAKKTLLKNFIEPISKSKNITIKLDMDLKVKRSSNKSKKTTQTKRAGSIKGPAVSLAGVGRKGSQKDVKQTTPSPIQLMGLINAKLPQTVAANMGVPRLENRTGTFASSVRVTEVQKTQKGFLSFGYTYQKSPYSVFESTSGTRFASVERDPRSLIDLSIREIAQQMAIGRFYTRRV